MSVLNTQLYVGVVKAADTIYAGLLQRDLHVETLDASMAKRCRAGIAKLHHAKMMR